MGMYENIINSKKDNTNTTFERIINSKKNVINNSSSVRDYTSNSLINTKRINDNLASNNDIVVHNYASTLNKKEQDKQNYISKAADQSLFGKIQAEKEFERTYNDKQYIQSKKEYVNKYMPSNTLSDYINADYSNLPSALYEQIGKPLIKTAANIPVKVAEGALKGGEGILDTLTYVGGNAINLGANKLGLTSDQDYEIYKGAINNMVKDDLTGKAMQKFGWDEEMTSKFEEGSAVKKDNLFGQVAQGVGQMFPTLLVGNYTGNIGATATSGTSLFGSSLEEAYKEGASDKDAVMYAIGKTAVEIGSEWITGGIPGLKGKGGLDYLADKGIDKISNELIKELTRYGYSMVGEGAEEALAEILTPILKNATYSEGEQINWSDVINSAIVGGITGGVLEAPMNISNIFSAVQNMQNKQNIQNTSTSVVQESVYDRIVNSNNNDAEISSNQQRVQNNTNNTNNTTNNLIESAKKYNIDTNSETVKSINQVLTNRNIESTFDSSIFNSNSENALWTKIVDTEGNVKRTVVFNPKSNTETILQNVAVHELTHDIISGNEQNSFSNILEFVKTREGYDQARIDLEKQYASLKDKNGNFIYDKTSNEFSNMIDEEIVASVLGEKLGDENFIRELNTYQPSTAKKIYDWVIDKLNKLNKIVGYKSEKLYWQDVKNKFEQLYAKEYAGNSSYENDLKFMVTGYKGAKQLDKITNTKDFSRNYNEAIQMDKIGKTSNEIREKTGWYKDANGDWKFEISDKESEINKKTKLTKNSDYTVSSLLTHKLLYDMYPHLKKTKVLFRDINSRGLTNKITGTIYINNNLINDKAQLKKTLIHEIQHNIQGKEKFQKGTSIKEQNGNYERYKNNFGETEARETSERIDLDFEQRLKNPSYTSIYRKGQTTQKLYTREDNKWYNLLGGKSNEIIKENISEDSKKNRANNIYDNVGRIEKGLDYNSSFSLDSKKSNWNKFVESNFKGTRKGETLQEIKKNKNPFKQSTVEERLSNDVKLFNLENSKKIMNPNEISTLTKENSTTTPSLPKIKRNGVKATKKSSFYGNVTEKSKFLSPKSRNILKSEDDVNYYKGVSNEESLKKASERLDNGGSAETLNWFQKDSTKATAVDVAEGWILMKRYQDAKDYDSMVEVAKKMREMGTSAGQTVQAYNIMARLTPEGMVKYAQSELTEAFDKLSKNKTKQWIDKHKTDFDLNTQEVEFIIKQMEDIKKTKSEYEKKVKLAEIQKLMTDKLPPSKGAGIKSWMRISMLFNPKTQVRNIAGNAVIMPVNAISDLTSSAIDRFIASKTGVRTTGTTSIKSQLKGFKKGLYESYNDFKKGINTRNIEGNRFEITEGKSFSDKNILGKSLNRVDNVLSFMLDAGDRGFYEATFTNSINNQLALNKTTEVTQEMIDIATQEALSRTWQDNNNYTKFVLNIRKGLNFGKNYGLGDILIPFAKTPANLTKAIVDYSPVGLVNSVIEGVKLKRSLNNGQFTPQLQHQFVQSLGKATAGTMLYVLGYALAKAGITTGKSDEDSDVANFLKNTLGVNSYSIKIGNKTFTYDWAQPVAAPFEMMANLVQKQEDGETLSQALITTLDTGLNVIFEQSFLESMNNFLSEPGKIGTKLAEQFLDLPARAVPTLFKQVTDMVDGTQRTTFEKGNPFKTAVNKVKAKIPGLSQTLAPTVDTMGREIQKYGGENNIFNVFFNPANMNKGQKSESAEEIYKVYQETGDKTIFPRVAPYSINIDGKNVNLTPKQRTEFQKISGKIIEDNVKKLKDNGYYDKLSYEEKIDVINGIVNYSYNKAKEKVLGIKMANTYNKVNEWLDDGKSLSDYYANKEENNYALSNKEKYNTITGLDVTYDNYSEYQKEISALKKKYEGTENSKIRKQKVSEYINSLPLKKQQKIMLYKELGGYSISVYKNEMYQYINSLKISKSEKEKIWKRLYG